MSNVSEAAAGEPFKQALSRRFAYIFDFDGVLVDSMEIYYTAFSQVLKEKLNITLERDYYMSMSGMSATRQLDCFCDKFKLNFDREAIMSAIFEQYSTIFNSITPITNNIQLVRMLLDNGVPVAVASGSELEHVKPLLDAYGLSDISVVITGDQVTNCKPHPETFLTAAKQLGVDPIDCIVIEDAAYGITAAKAAGMRVFHFIDSRL